MPLSGDGPAGIPAEAAVIASNAIVSPVIKLLMRHPLIKPTPVGYIPSATIFRKEVIQCLIVMTCGP
jgi:hypothetical protein